MAQPVAVVGDGEPAGLLGQGFLALQGLELVGFGDLGGDHFEDPVREPAQRDRVVLPGQADQVGLGVAAVLDRQRVDTLHDHGGLFLRHLPGGHRVPDRLVVVVQGVGELQAALGVPFGLPGLVRPVAARVGGTGRGAEVEPVGVVGVAELELGDLVPQLRPGRSGWSRSRRPGGSTARGRRPRAAAGRRRRSWTSTGCCPVSSNAVVIQGILASTTDSFGPGKPGHSGQTGERVSRDFWDSMSWSRQARPAGIAASGHRGQRACGGLDKLDHRWTNTDISP